MEVILTFIQRAIMQGIPILFGASGEILTEKSGNLNLGIPGIMYMGGVSGLIAGFLYEKAAGENASGFLGVLISFLFSIFVAVLGGLIYSVLTITLRANQNVVGLALTTFGVGFGNFFGGSLSQLAGGVGQISVKATAAAYRTTVPGLSNIPVIGKILFSYGFLTYLAIIIALCLNYFLLHTRKGLNLRAVGENPGTADAAGIDVTKYKYLTTCLGAGISGLGGTYYVMNYIRGTWENQGTIEALGWLAVALVIFATWKPLRSIWGSYLFGMLYWAYFYIPNLTRSSKELFKMLPYVVTLIVLLVVSLRRKKEDQPPASLGLPYFREER